LVFRTPVSARSYRASAFLLDLLLFCQANKFIHSFIQEEKKRKKKEKEELGLLYKSAINEK